jgi:hypothetical protein
MKLIEQTDVMGNIYEVVVIENENGSTTSMSKAEYDRRQAGQSTPIDTGDE